MRLYQIPLPILDNAGTEYTELARKNFLSVVLHHAGGYTLLPEAEGAWRDNETGKTYYDAVTPVQFALDDGAWKGRVILAAFHQCFPDQLCAMVADLGEVTFHTLKQEEHA